MAWSRSRGPDAGKQKKPLPWWAAAQKQGPCAVRNQLAAPMAPPTDVKVWLALLPKVVMEVDPILWTKNSPSLATPLQVFVTDTSV
jgi:hypothetical protein